MGKLTLVKTEYLQKYIEKQPISLLKHFNSIKKIEILNDNFNFYFSCSAVYSSMIEGNIIDFDSYLKYSESGMNTTGKSFIEIEDLKKAYKFAKENPLSLASFLEAHKYISETIISESQYRGVIRDKNVGVFGDGKKVYSGASKDIVEAEMTKLFADIKVLLDANLTVSETFYYASMLHLVFVKIHPFADGNGRSARLLEKWFLASKMGENAWFIQSEKLYQTRVKSYYKNVSLGQSYDVVDYDFCLPFLLMLPMALRIK